MTVATRATVYLCSYRINRDRKKTTELDELVVLVII
ncbi:hypothetical protein ABH916_003461 [Peribacillus frigoritolerans]